MRARRSQSEGGSAPSAFFDHGICGPLLEGTASSHHRSRVEAARNGAADCLSGRLGDDVSNVGARCAEREQRSLGQNLALIGSIGWLVVVPTLGAMFLGRYLDRHFHGQMFWSGCLMCIGLVMGCFLAWRRVQKP